MTGPIMQTGIGLSQDLVERLDRLRACYGRSRSWIIQRALREGALAGLEQERLADVRRFNELAAAAGLTWQQGAKLYAERYGRMTYPPTVEVDWLLSEERSVA